MPSPADLGRAAAEAGAVGALALISPAGLPRRALMAYRVASAALTGGVTYDIARKDDDLAGQPAVRAGLALGAAVAVFGAATLWERWDSMLHRNLLARGVKHPRLVIAAIAAAASLADTLLQDGHTADEAAADAPDSR